MFEPINEEISKLEKEILVVQSETLRALYSGQLSGLKMGLALLANYKMFDVNKFFCWGGKLLAVTDDKISGKERIKFTIQQIIKNDKITAGKNINATFNPYIQGHGIGLESVLMFL